MKKQKVSTQTALVFFIIFMAGWFLHGFFTKPDMADCRQLKVVDDTIIEAFYSDDAESAAIILIEKGTERKEIIKNLGY